MFTLKSLIVVLIFFFIFIYLFIYFFVSDLLSLAKRLFAAAYCTKRQQSKKYKQKIEHWNLSFISIPKIFVCFFHSNPKLSGRSGRHLILHLIETLFLFPADVNECTSLPSTCHVNAQCSNTIGSYRCACSPGYTGNGKTCRGTWFMKNRPYSYSQYWSGTSLQCSLMRGNILKIICI